MSWLTKLIRLLLFQFFSFIELDRQLSNFSNYQPGKVTILNFKKLYLFRLEVLQNSSKQFSNAKSLIKMSKLQHKKHHKTSQRELKWFLLKIHYSLCIILLHSKQQQCRTTATIKDSIQLSCATAWNCSKSGKEGKLVEAF